MPPEVLLRRGGSADAEALARVHLTSRRAARMPPSVHTEAEVRAFLAQRFEADEVWLAEVDDEVVGQVVGYLRLTETWLDDLYVVPAWAGRGIGSMLLDLAKSLRPDGFGLWVFEVNTPARAFYARHGLVEVLRTDGSDNEERAPDLHLAWRA